MAFIEPMHRNKPNITYLLTWWQTFKNATENQYEHEQNVTPMLTYNPNDNWPQFLVVEAADGNPKPLTDRMNVFAWHKAVEGMGGSYKSIKPMNDGRQLLVHFDNKVYSDSQLKADKLIDIPVKVTPTEHSTLQDV